LVDPDADTSRRARATRAPCHRTRFEVGTARTDRVRFCAPGAKAWATVQSCPTYGFRPGWSTLIGCGWKTAGGAIAPSPTTCTKTRWRIWRTWPPVGLR
jgi:hypothetical protein